LKAPEQRVLLQAKEYRSFTFLLSRNCWSGPVLDRLAQIGSD